MPDEEVTPIIEFFPQSIIDILTKPIDPEAVVAGTAATKWLSSIKNIYITERLNHAFGYGRWQITDQAITVTEPKVETREDRQGNPFEVETKPMVVLKVTLILIDYPWFQAWSYGGNNNADLGDAYKGAVSDALSKICAVHFGVAQDVYKGHPPERGPQKTKEQIKAEAEAKVAETKKKIEEHKNQQEPQKQLVTRMLEESLKKEETVIKANRDEHGDAAISDKQVVKFKIEARKNHSDETIAEYIHNAGLSSIKFCPKVPREFFQKLLEWAMTPEPIDSPADNPNE